MTYALRRCWEFMNYQIWDDGDWPTNATTIDVEKPFHSNGEDILVENVRIIFRDFMSAFDQFIRVYSLF